MADPIITLTGGVANEGDDVPFTITLSHAAAGEVTVDWRLVQDGSADGRDVVFPQGGSITFLAGETSKQILIGTDFSTFFDFDENVSLELSEPVNAVLAGSEATLKATGVILDTSGSAPKLGLFVSDPVLQEGQSGSKLAVFEVRLSQPHGTDITLAYTTADGTAKAGSDYVAKSGTITFLAGQTVASVEVEVKGDTTVETAETFSLVVTPNSQIASATADSTGVATILDNDPVSAPPVMSLVGGVANEGDEVPFTVTLSRPAAGEVTVDWRLVQDGSADGRDVDFPQSGSITFLAGETSKQIPIATDFSTFFDFDENFSLELSEPVNAVLAGGEATLKATGVILDTSGTASKLGLFVSDPVLQEGQTGTKLAVFEVRLSRPHDTDITLAYTTANGTATAGPDYVAKTGTITFLAGQTVASIAVEVKGDTIVETAESFSLVVTPNSLIANATADSTGVATILDNDPVSGPPVMSLVGGVANEGDEVPFTVTLSRPSAGEVTVDWRLVQDGSADGGDVDFPQGGSITFLAGETSKRIPIGTDFSTFFDFDENFSLELSDPVNAVFAGGEATLKATGVILDTSGTDSKLGLFVSDPVLHEGHSDTKLAVFEVRLSRPHHTDITLAYTTVDGSADAGQDYAARSGNITFLAGQTVASVAVPVFGDRTEELNETFSLVVTPTSAIANGVADNVGVATILNDDPSVTFIDGTPGDDDLFGDAGSDIIRGRGGDDSIYGRAGDDTLFGGPGNDSLYGGPDNDVLRGAGGEDALRGGPGNDRLFGGPDGDILLGGGDIDILRGGGGDDIVRGHAGDDRLFGTGGNDNLHGGGGNDIMRGGPGHDILRGGPGNNVLIGNGGHDRLIGGNHADDLYGQGGNDELFGNGGNDRLIGGPGNDRLLGQAGNDTLIGGAGADLFVFQPNGGHDQVLGFQDDLDRLDFSAFNFASKASVLALATQNGGDVVFDLPGGETVELADFDINLLGGEDILI